MSGILCPEVQQPSLATPNATFEVYKPLVFVPSTITALVTDFVFMAFPNDNGKHRLPPSSSRHRQYYEQPPHYSGSTDPAPMHQHPFAHSRGASVSSVSTASSGDHLEFARPAHRDSMDFSYGPGGQYAYYTSPATRTGPTPQAPYATQQFSSTQTTNPQRLQQHIMDPAALSGMITNSPIRSNNPTHGRNTSASSFGSYTSASSLDVNHGHDDESRGRRDYRLSTDQTQQHYPSAFTSPQNQQTHNRQYSNAGTFGQRHSNHSHSGSASSQSSSGYPSSSFGGGSSSEGYGSGRGPAYSNLGDANQPSHATSDTTRRSRRSSSAGQSSNGSSSGNDTGSSRAPPSVGDALGSIRANVRCTWCKSEVEGSSLEDHLEHECTKNPHRNRGQK
ncbi:hypothetical protein VNI00_016113 [Paramarasmius palmivorus]|uniref:Uncharacterized protein n=1 Tax=Paramarasmius palmivorus TaxID=297713 RepID=A0AAW0BG77_9AGAR